ncbi:translational GTPase TypA [Candidatus Woesebacteria bacterium]|nr:translational GTPase TypA [Candidatus Woesebacteria bacterium]
MKIRNIAIIAHVDHGKTTLVDGMLKQTKTFRENQAEMSQTTILDSNAQERERGITILAKTTSVMYEGTKINIIDTPGHADFAGEVERVISMAEGALLIVDAAEGPLPQTRFVLEKALENRLKMMVVINKIDRKDAEPERVKAEIDDLFLQLANSDDQLEFPVLYAVAREGKVWTQMPMSFDEDGDLRPLFEKILEVVPAPNGQADKPFKMFVTNIDHDNYKGTFAVGKVSQGVLKTNQEILMLEENNKVGSFRAQGVFTSEGLNTIQVAESYPGDIISITGNSEVKIGQTLADPADPTGFPMITVTEPTLNIQIAASTSPVLGREGEFFTVRQIGSRLERERKINIGLRIVPNSNGTGFIVSGRGELHLAVLIENMRREGYELEVGKPEVIIKEIDGVKCEPSEELTVEIDAEFTGAVVEELGKRRAQMKDSVTNEKNVTRMIFEITSRNLLGFRSEILTKTRGNGLFASRFLGYFPVSSVVSKNRNGVLVASESGTATAYALDSIQQRGLTFISPGESVYEGQIIGINKKQEDMEMNIAKGKKLTNFRANADFGVQLTPPTIFSLEQCLDFLEDDELLEVTPKSLRLRKRVLNKNERNKSSRR